MIARKTKFDSLLRTKISQNVSPGPAAYTIRRKLGGTHQSIGQKLATPTGVPTERNLQNVGPGSYNVSRSTLKKDPSVVIGRMARYFGIKFSAGPDPTTYNNIQRLDEKRSNSRERNSVRPVIGTAKRFFQGSEARGSGPCPQTYETHKNTNIGDEKSIGINFTRTVRPISARTG